MKVHNVMQRGLYWVEADTPVYEIARIMKSRNVWTIPVGRNDRLVGLVTDRDIVCRGGGANGKSWVNALARDVMARKVAYCFETDDLCLAATIMSQKNTRQLAVLTQQKRLSGTVSLCDVVNKSPEEYVMHFLPSMTANNRVGQVSRRRIKNGTPSISAVGAVSEDTSNISISSI